MYRTVGSRSRYVIIIYTQSVLYTIHTRMKALVHFPINFVQLFLNSVRLEDHSHFARNRYLHISIRVVENNYLNPRLQISHKYMNTINPMYLLTCWIFVRMKLSSYFRITIMVASKYLLPITCLLQYSLQLGKIILVTI